MGQIKDLTGQHFGLLTVIKDSGKRQNRQVVWECECECGNAILVMGSLLRNGHTSSCGCKRKKTLQKKYDLTNQVFGSLTVESFAYQKDKYFWNCKCTCGNTRIVSGSDLRMGNITKCLECSKKNRINTNCNGLGPIKDLTGKIFGELTVLNSTSDRDNHGRMMWECQCSCGKKCQVSSLSLVTGNTQSCGHLKQTKFSKGETQIEKILKDNNIEYQNQYSFLDCRSPKDALLYYDFAILKNGKVIKLIEYDGLQHYQPVEYFGGEEAFQYRQICDNIKTEYAKNHNIPLIRISYNQEISLEKIFYED